MDRNFVVGTSCVVCGIETKRHSGWFLVRENRWLDRLVVLSWHSVVARQPRTYSVCGEQHLRTLLTHWLTYANLEFLAAGNFSWIEGNHICKADHDTAKLSAGKVVGELAVHRESVSRVWTGSPESLASILDALIGGIDKRPHLSAMPLANRSTGFLRKFRCTKAF